MTKFNVRKYKDDGEMLVDGSDFLGNNGQVISIRNIRNSSAVYFKAFITAFNDTFSPNYTPTEVFGRTDPIYQYKNTTRAITLAWKIPAASESEAFENLDKVQKFLRMLYPSYTDANSALTLSEAPLVRIKVMNLMQKIQSNSQANNTGSGTGKDTKAFNEYLTTNNSSKGLLGVITNCNVNYNLEGPDGVFEKGFNSDGLLGPRTTILPKLIDINISFSPLHEKTLGYGDGASISGFPYGVSTGNKTLDEGIIPENFKEVPEMKSNTFTDEDLRAQAINPTFANRGKTLADLIALKETLEEKRRAASSAQQKKDKELAAYRRAERKISRKERRGKISELEAETQRFEAADGLSDLVNNASAASEELQNLEDLLG